MHSLVVPEHEPVFDICEVHVTPKYKIDLRKNVKCNKSFKSKATAGRYQPPQHRFYRVRTKVRNASGERMFA